MAQLFDKLGAGAAVARAIYARLTDPAEKREFTSLAADAILSRRQGRRAPVAPAAVTSATAAPVAPRAETTNPDDASDVVALAERVGLKGFAKAPAAGDQATPAPESAVAPDEGLGELLALAERVGLKGFRKDPAA